MPSSSPRVAPYLPPIPGIYGKHVLTDRAVLLGDDVGPRCRDRRFSHRQALSRRAAARQQGGRGRLAALSRRSDIGGPSSLPSTPPLHHGCRPTTCTDLRAVEARRSSSANVSRRGAPHRIRRYGRAGRWETLDGRSLPRALGPRQRLHSVGAARAPGRPPCVLDSRGRRGDLTALSLSLMAAFNLRRPIGGMPSCCAPSWRARHFGHHFGLAFLRHRVAAGIKSPHLAPLP